MTILFVDDHHALRTVFAEILRNDRSHMVLEAGNLAESEHLLERYHCKVDLLLIEAVLTTANGREVAHRLLAKCPEMRTLYVSEHRPEDLVKEGLLPEGAHFLRKPFAADQLEAKLEAMKV